MLKKKRNPRVLPFLALSISALILSPALAEFEITEFLAENTGAELTDSDGFPADWIEISNPDATAASVAGYFLTDDPGNLSKWALPDVTISSNGYLLVFATGKDRAVAGAELHTNFSLGVGGEFLALVKPDGVTIVSSFSPSYPDQLPDISFGAGYPVSGADFILFGDALTYLVPDSDIGDSWQSPGFDDAAWTAAHTPVGYGYSISRGDDFDISADGELSVALRGAGRASVYMRMPFDLVNPGVVSTLTLKMKIDDGFVAYLNGEKVAEFNVPDPVAWDSVSDVVEEVTDGADYDYYPLDFAGKLVAGENILAVHALNDKVGSSDFLTIVELVGEVRDLSVAPQFGYFEELTPANANGILSTAPPAEVGFSVTSRAFTQDFDLALSVATPGATIRYTDDGTVPSNDLAALSAEYTAPISITGSTLIRAKAFFPGALDGPGRTEGFYKLASSEANFSSDLPVVMLSSFGGGSPPSSGSNFRDPMFMLIFEPDPLTGRTTLTGTPSIATRGGYRKRGSSSAGFAKYAMSMESWDEFDEDKDIEPLGFSAEGDWILNSRYTFDMALIRNPFLYELSNQIGRWAVKTQFVELYNDVNGGDITSNDYFGLYCFMEKIEPDNGRLDISDLDPWENAEPDVTGGYVFKQDRGTDNINVSSMGGMPVTDPDPLTPAQKSYLEGYLNEMDVGLGRVDGMNLATGKHFSEYLDVSSFVDNFWLNVLAMDPDWGRLSQYFYKDRGGLLNAGPIWDYDRTMGSRDSRDDNPRRWDVGDSETFYDTQYPWFGRLFGFNSNNQPNPGANSTHPDVFQDVIDRWYELRANEFALSNIDLIIDGMAAEITEAQARNFSRWSGRNPGSIQGTSFAAAGTSGWPREISHMKGWLEARAEWIDDQFFAPPTFNQPGGVVPEGTQVTLAAADGDEVYYTLDGTDPRVPGGGISASALVASGPITLTSSSTIRARAYKFHNAVLGEEWGAPGVESYVVGADLATSDNLVISEIMYNPVGPSAAELTAGFTDGDQFEYIELLNISANLIDLRAVAFTTGINFDFVDGDILELAPGARVLIVREQAAFVERYGAAFNALIAGEFTNETALRNSGEQLILSGEAVIRDFEYNDRFPWSESADGDGPSLVLIDPGSNPDHSVATNWRASVGAMGSVGVGDAVAFSGDPNIDVDGDGLDAFAEYAFGTDASSPGGSVLTATSSGPGALTITYPINLAAEDAVVSVEFSTDLETWTTPVERGSSTETHNGDGTATLELEYSATPVAGEQLFVRLRVTNR